ncbi:hypothetical protein D9756_001097 [Leucocoprinus leucothites]|uniref:Uncharacterized protein n=1 Tax=Leucocoprinus leucothites TaxID=201217 RepID=A0A8H5GE53_9AGAR|nr:hypothetical protein D9756_001097 [Leucoagaricus leucothites]
MANSTLPNPDTLLNHLPPDEAHRFEIAKNVCVAVLGIGIWDVLIYLPEDIKLVYNNLGIDPTESDTPKRLVAIVYVLFAAIVLTTPVPNCDGIRIATGSACFLGMIFTSFLFLRRLQAVYSAQRKAVWIFGFLWLGANGVAVLGPIAFGSRYIDGYCNMYDLRGRGYAATARFLPALFDAVVFIAISYKVISNHVDIESNGVTWRSFFNGRLPPISRELLRGGQQYYMIGCAATIAYGAFLYTPSFPGIYIPMIQVVVEVLDASMACRVYRNLKLLDLSVQAFHDGVPAISDLRFGVGDPSQTKPVRSESPRRHSSFPVISFMPTTNSIVTIPANAHVTANQC